MSGVPEGIGAEGTRVGVSGDPDSTRARGLRAVKPVNWSSEGSVMTESQSEFGYTVKAVPRGVRGSGVPVRSSADTGEGFGEVI